MISPASGFAPTNTTNSPRSGSDISGFVSLRNRAVSTTVIGVSAMHSNYTQSAYSKQEGLWRGGGPTRHEVEAAASGRVGSGGAPRKTLQSCISSGLINELYYSQGVVLFYTRGDVLNVHPATLDYRCRRRGGCLPAAGGAGVGLAAIPRTGPERNLQGSGFVS